MTVRRYRALPKESDLERTITDGVENLGGRVFSIRDSRKLNVQDMPDLLIVLPPVVALIELKSQKRAITDGQQLVLDLLARCDQLVTGITRPVPKDGEMSLDEALARIGVKTT